MLILKNAHFALNKLHSWVCLVCAKGVQVYYEKVKDIQEWSTLNIRVRLRAFMA